MSRDSEVRRLTTGVQAVAALVTLAGVAWALAHRTDPSLGSVLVCAVLVLSVWLFPVALHFGANGYLWIWGEAALAVLLVLLPAGWVLLVAGSATLAALLIRRQVPIKALFNAGTTAIGAGASSLLWALVNGFTGSLPTVSYIVLAAVTLVSAIISTVLVNMVVATASGESWSVSSRESRLDALLLLISVALGPVLAALATWHVWLLLVMPVLVFVLGRFAHNRVELSEQERAWQRLDDTVRSLNTLDEHRIEEQLIVGATGLLRAESATVERDGAPTSSPAADHNSTVVELTGPNSSMGTLRLKFDASISLSRRERQALNTLAAAGGAALHNARQHAQATYDATHDQLTGLGNRRAIVTAIEGLAGDGAETGCGLLLVDLDRFKEVNDTLGHSAGDIVLREVSQRLSRAVRDDATVARLGGDEFAILLPELADPDIAEQVAQRIIATLSRPTELGSVTVSVGGSVGIVCVPADTDSTADMLRCADVAMYVAKDLGGGVSRRYDAKLDAASVERLALEPALRQALTVEDQIVVYMQPQVDMVTGEATGAEALVRWQHPELGMLAPYLWLPLVTECGLQGELTRLVLRDSLRQRAIWAAHGVDVPVSVNLAPRDLLDLRLPAMVARLLAQHVTAPDRLILEIPETLVGAELDTTANVLAELHDLGVELSLDDFGAGGASIAVLTRVPVAELKVDRSFVTDLVADLDDTSPGAVARARAAKAVVAAAVGLGRTLEQRVIAEGVETEEQVARLHALGCTTAQGYLYERPQPGDQALASLLSRSMRDSSRTVVRLASRRA